MGHGGGEASNRQNRTIEGWRMTVVQATEFRGRWEHDYCHSCMNRSQWPKAGRYESNRTGLGSAERWD